MSRSIIHQQQIDLHAMGIINAQVKLNRQENLKNKRLQSDLSIDAGPINIQLAEEDSQAQLSHYTARNYLMGLTQDTPDSFRFTSQSMIPKMGNKNSDKNESQNQITFADEMSKVASLVYQNSNHTTKLIEERLKSDENKQPLHLNRQNNNNFQDGVSSFASALTMNMNQGIDNDQEEVILSPALGYYANMLPSSTAVTASRKQAPPNNQELTFSNNTEQEKKLESQENKTTKGSFYPALSEIEQNIIKSKNNLHQYKTNFAPHLNLPNKKLNNFIKVQSDANQILDTQRIKINERTESGNNTARNVKSRTCPCCNYQQDTKETTQEDDEHHLKASVHENLYRKGLQKIELLERICQQRKQELLQKEIEGCVFSPQLQKNSLTNLKASASNLLVPDTARDRQIQLDKGLISSRSTSEKLPKKEVLKDWQENLRYGNEQSIQGDTIKSKLSKFLNPIQKQQKLNSTLILKSSTATLANSTRVRSPERFYADMIKFKDTKEARLQRKREQLEQEQKQLSKRAFSSDEEQQNFFEKLSQKNVNDQKSLNQLRSSSQGHITNRKDLCINIKNLTYQSPAHLIAQKRGFMLKNNQCQNKVTKSCVFKPEIDSEISSKRLKSQKVEMRRAKQLSEQLYDDYFQRTQRRKLLEQQEQERLAEEVNKKLTKMHELSQPDRILANKIALRCKSLYDSMFQYILKEIKVSQKAHLQIQQEQDNEQATNSKMTQSTTEAPKLDQAFNIEGIIIEETSKEALSSATAKGSSSTFVYNSSLQGSGQADIQQQEIQCDIPGFLQHDNKIQNLEQNQCQKVEQFIVEIQGIPFQYFLHLMSTLNYLSEPTVQIVQIIRELVRANIQKQQESDNQKVVSLLIKIDQIYQENQNIVLPEMILLQQAWSIVAHPQSVPKQALSYNPIYQENETQMIFGVLTQAFGEQNCIDMLLTQQNMHALNSNCFKNCKDEQQANILIVNLRNLIVFLIGIENILVENMTYDPNLNIQEDSNVIQKQFGFFISQLFFIKDNADCQKLSLHFQKFVFNKTFKDREQQIKQKDARLTSRGVINPDSHQPQINQKSKKIAERLYSFLFQNRTENELNSARSQLFCQDNKSLIRKRVGTKYEDFLIERGKQQMMKRKRLGEEQKEFLPEECTFYPKINPIKIKRDNSKSVETEEVMNFGIF